ncbi:CLUMA_CG014101, isoform A [Clunio marinus]|uniref:CLUMA_CG014101, isoform A n=1 Tax=Clunio marinus TaxID=568069 RepID=A0A1J1IM89_9DIPT|nr:CLUMA_CG014101, isoform A [Clunio marinus]
MNWCMKHVFRSERIATLHQACCGHFNYRSRTFTIGLRSKKTYYEFVSGNGFSKIKVRIEGNKIIQNQEGHRKIVTVREFFEDKMLLTITVDHIVVKRLYKKTDMGFFFLY